MTTTTNRAANDVGSFTTVLGWLNNAVANGARSPRVKIRTTAGLMGFALPRNRRPGDAVLFVKIDGNYVGTIRCASDGSRFFPRGWVAQGTFEALRAIGDNPLAAAVGHGHATGNCSFCARDLTDPRSVSVGYGPICAGHFGLPWGEVGAAAARIAAPRRAPVVTPVAPAAPDLVALRAAAVAAERETAAAAREEFEAQQAVRDAQARLLSAIARRDRAEIAADAANTALRNAEGTAFVPVTETIRMSSGGTTYAAHPSGEE